MFFKTGFWAPGKVFETPDMEKMILLSDIMFCLLLPANVNRRDSLS